MKTNTVKGFKDFIGLDASKRELITNLFRKNFELYGFGPTETPIIEFEEFVKGENPNDDAVRDIFKLTDRGKRSLALRYEFTFQLKRIAKDQKLPFKRYQIGYNFRDEPIRVARTRQFIQADCDIVGSDLDSEAELLKMSNRIFNELEIPIKIYINNRKLVNEILVTEKVPEKIRDQVIREIDKLDKLSKADVANNLKKLGFERLVNIFTKPEKSFEKYNYYSEVKELKKACKALGVVVEFRPYLSRGFSYYNGSVFEIWSKKLGVSLCGGGSYKIGKVQATGISFGLEPIFLLSSAVGKRTKLCVISIGEDKESARISESFRDNGISVDLILNKGTKKAMEYANAAKFPYVLFVGSRGVKEKKFTLKEMDSGKERDLNEEGIIRRLG
ncbi:MAG: histidine--tRNA ligase [Nanoarchaeota archaeon]|nr:histidine--tRNA ligase [Nanoarchaeota archaeon]